MRRLEMKLPEDLLRRIGEVVDRRVINSCEEAIELLLRRALCCPPVERAVILGGGKGVRLRPFTYELPKPLIPIKGKPLMQHIVEFLRYFEIRDITIAIGYLGSKVKEYFGDGSKFGVRISYVEEEQPLGTAGPLNLLRDQLRSTFLMMNGDVLADLNLNRLLSFHSQHDGLATIALVRTREAERFGVIELNGDKVVRFVEKPKAAKEALVNAGIYIFEREIMSYVPKGYAMLETDVFPRLVEEGLLYGYEFNGQWLDVGTPEAYEKAIKQWVPPWRS